MSWIAADADLPEKPKVRQMARSIGIDRWSVAGRLVSVWGWFDKASADGFIAGAVEADVDDLAGHDGFANAMQMVGWLVIEPSGLLIPDFDDHHGNSAKKRALGALRQGRYRKRKGDAQALRITQATLLKHLHNRKMVTIA
jgi:DNA replication protein DnaT